MIERSKLGELIFFCRKIQKVSQYDLCSGLCSVSTLSRMEHGEIDIPILLAQALLQRLGVDIDRFELLLGEQEYKYFAQRQIIEDALHREDILQAEQELVRYQEMMAQEKLHQQYVKFLNAKLLILKLSKLEAQVEGRNHTKKEQKSLAASAEQLLKEALELTILESPKQKHVLLSKTEIEILMTAVQQYGLEKIVCVEEFVNKYESLELKEKIYPLIKLQKAKRLLDREKSEEALAELREGMAIAEISMSYLYCAELHFLYAKALQMQWQEKPQWKQIQKECIEHCKAAYYLYEFDGDCRKKEVEQWGCTVLGNL